MAEEHVDDGGDSWELHLVQKNAWRYLWVARKGCMTGYSARSALSVTMP